MAAGDQHPGGLLARRYAIPVALVVISVGLLCFGLPAVPSLAGLVTSTLGIVLLPLAAMSLLWRSVPRLLQHIAPANYDRWLKSQARRFVWPLFLTTWSVVSVILTVTIPAQYAALHWLPTSSLLVLAAIVASWQMALLILGRFAPARVNAAQTRVRLWSLLSFLVLLAASVGSAHVNAQFNDALMEKGDAIVPLIESYQREHGRCPVAPGHLAQADIQLRQALADDEFHVYEVNLGRCYISFTDTLLNICSRLVAQDTEWDCDD